ncbi:MAG: hypothetical protein J2P54_00240, partial [Bradyrhizobiaceae bacterium]|nr:hypothetical protein [Bradyrhizobiaceae bacterium]
RWLDATAEENPLPEAGLVAAWALPPEQAELRDDIDGFRLFLRNAAPKPGAAADAPLVYPDWPAPIAQFGPVQIVGRGALESFTPDPSLTVDLSDGELVPEAPRVSAVGHNARTAFRTNLTLDGASGVFVGGTLTIGARSMNVVANSDGPSLIVVVEHAPDAPPPANSAGATLRTAAGALVLFDTDVPDLQGTAQLTPRCGLLVDEQAIPARYAVLRKNGSEFLCMNSKPPDGVRPVAPEPDNELAWYPVWFASLSDSGFGPVADARTPVANAQVAVQSVRLMQTRALASAYSATLTVTAVDVAVPPTPTIMAIPFDPAGACAMLASRADWYGNSHFTFAWSPQAYCVFTVYRALADEVFRLDREYMSQANSERNLASDRWPPGVFGDDARKARVEEELAALDDALDEDADDVYADLCIDTQMFLGLQAHTWAAFTPLFGRPISETSYTDTLNGRTRAHWFYAVTARSLAGVESLPSTISPPICCPDVVPPAPPLAHSALAAVGAVKLKWLASPDGDTHHYEIYAARSPDAVANLDTLTPVSSYGIENGVHTALMSNYAPAPHVSGRTIERFVPRARNEMGEWCFWIVATDTSGNRSEPSRMLRGRALLPPPDPPVWISATRTPAGNPKAVALSWSHDTEPRLACLVERRPVGGGLWAPASGWLPRASYQFEDKPPDLNAGWEYRLRVRDHLGQAASSLPSITLQEV